MALHRTKRPLTSGRRAEEYLHRIADASERIHTPVLKKDELDEAAAEAHIKWTESPAAHHHGEALESEKLQPRLGDRRNGKTEK